MSESLEVKASKQQSESGFLGRAFLDHPESVDETYFEHMRFALKFSGTMFFAAFAALVHAFIPALCECTASNIIKKLHTRLVNRF